MGIKFKIHENKRVSALVSYVATLLIVALTIGVFALMRVQAADEPLISASQTQDSVTSSIPSGVSRPAYLFYVSRTPQYSMDDIINMDLTAPSNVTYEDLCAVSQQGLVGLEQYFINAEKEYGVNCVFLMSIAALESGWGTSLFRENNLFGFGQYDFASKEECIYTVAKALSENYLSEDGSFHYGYTVRDVWVKYATSTTWGYKIENIMYNLYNRCV